MRLVPEHVLGMAGTIESAVEAASGHAAAIEAVGFQASHAGQEYLEQGKKLEEGFGGVVSMLQSWSDASNATATAFRQAVAMNVAVDEQHRGQIEGLA